METETKVGQNCRKNPNKREREIQKAVAEIITPPMSPDHEYIIQNLMNERRVNTVRQLGRKRVRRDRLMSYRRIDKLNVALCRQNVLANTK